MVIITSPVIIKFGIIHDGISTYMALVCLKVIKLIDS